MLRNFLRGDFDVKAVVVIERLLRPGFAANTVITDGEPGLTKVAAIDSVLDRNLQRGHHVSAST